MVAEIWGQTRNLDDLTFNPLDVTKHCSTKHCSSGRGWRGAEIWGQTRCPVCRSGTFNVQRSTLNVQQGDRKGACWAGYGDRHDVYWCGTALTLRSPPLIPSPTCGMLLPNTVTGTVFGRPGL